MSLNDSYSEYESNVELFWLYTVSLTWVNETIKHFKLSCAQIVLCKLPCLYNLVMHMIYITSLVSQMFLT